MQNRRVVKRWRLSASAGDLEANVASGLRRREFGPRQRQKCRAEELLTIHETTKFLNDDDAMGLFNANPAEPIFGAWFIRAPLQWPDEGWKNFVGLLGRPETQRPT